jgi:hypothetical protein
MMLLLFATRAYQADTPRYKLTRPFMPAAADLLLYRATGEPDLVAERSAQASRTLVPPGDAPSRLFS